MVLSADIAKQHRGIIAAVIETMADGSGSIAAEASATLQLGQAALHLASSLILQDPNANLPMMKTFEALLVPGPGENSSVAGIAGGMAASAAGLYGHILLHDKLQYSHSMFEVLAACLEHPQAPVRAVAAEVSTACVLPSLESGWSQHLNHARDCVSTQPPLTVQLPRFTLHLSGAPQLVGTSVDRLSTACHIAQGNSQMMRVLGLAGLLLSTTSRAGCC
jgi:hypothetical protein